MKPLAEEWLNKADEDLLVAERELCAEPPLFSAVCFHAQQTVGFYSNLLKRGVHGKLHHLSKKHFYSYCDELSLRSDYRGLNDVLRCLMVIARISGKRLSYKRLTKREGGI